MTTKSRNIYRFSDPHQSQCAARRSSRPSPLAAVIVGAGPAGVAPLVAALRMGRLSDLVFRGVRIIERSATLGSGQIGSYSIRSDSLADSFLKAIDADGTNTLRGLLDRPHGQYLHSERGKPVGLPRVGNFLTDLAKMMRDAVRAVGEDAFLTGLEAFRSNQQPNGSWVTYLRSDDEYTTTLHSQNIVIATGAYQPQEMLYAERVAGAPLLPRFSQRTLQSSVFLASDLQQALEPIARIRPIRRIAIVGGSHSAMASAYKCLHAPPGGLLDCEQVTVLHRGPLRLTYASPEAAISDGYTAFGSADICPKTGRVFPLAGFRSDARDLLRTYWGLGGMKRDSRLDLFLLDEHRYPQANQILEEADLIVAALGYRPRALPLFDHHGEPLSLQCEIGKGALVDGSSRILDRRGSVVPGAFGIGLCAGYPLAGKHGESSFKGEANGLALWQSDIGEDLVATLLDTLRTRRRCHSHG